MIVLDASLLIAHFEPADVHHDKATELLLAYQAEEFAASVISLAEIYVGAARANRVGDVERAIARLKVDAVPLPATAARRLAEIRAVANLKLPDCCVIQTAEQRNAAVATFDAGLADQARRFNLSIAREANVRGGSSWLYETAHYVAGNTTRGDEITGCDLA